MHVVSAVHVDYMDMLITGKMGKRLSGKLQVMFTFVSNEMLCKILYQIRDSINLTHTKHFII